MHRATLLVAALTLACSKPADTAQTAATADSAARARQDSVNRAQPGYIIDSALPTEEHVRRFKAAVGGKEVTALNGGSRSRDSLFHRFIRAVEKRDTADLRMMIVDAREFIDLVYPESPFTREPYKQAPGYIWSQVLMGSDKGVNRLLERMGGKPVNAVRFACATAPNREGKNLIWNQCTTTVRDANGEQVMRLFGSVVEREGRFKFLSYANGF